MSQRQAMYYIMTGETLGGKKAAELGLVNESVPLAQLRDRTRALADVLLKKNPVTLKAAKDAFRRVVGMTYDEAEDYLVVRQESANSLDKSEGRKEGIRQFIDDKSYKPGLATYRRDV
jgi:trans-feruloyl-CoA hydratase/vanillin synthase